MFISFLQVGPFPGSQASLPGGQSFVRKLNLPAKIFRFHISQYKEFCISSSSFSKEGLDHRFCISNLWSEAHLRKMPFGVPTRYWIYILKFLNNSLSCGHYLFGAPNLLWALMKEVSRADGNIWLFLTPWSNTMKLYADISLLVGS